MKTVTLLSRPGCHLCDEARAAIVALRGEGLRFALEEIDIESDERLHRDNLEKIPVVCVDGERVCELVIDLTGIRARLATVPTGP